MGVLERYQEKENRSRSKVESRYIINSAIPELVSKINTLQSRANNLAGQYNDRYLWGQNGSRMPVQWRADSADWLSAVSTEREKIGADVSSLAAQLRSYKDVLDEDTYRKGMDALDAVEGSSKSIFTSAKQENEIFSKFKNAEEYDDAVRWSEKNEKALMDEWDSLNHNLTLAYMQDDAAAIDSAVGKLDRLANFASGVYADKPLSTMAGEWINNRDIQRLGEIDAEISELTRQSGEYANNHLSGIGVSKNDYETEQVREARLNELATEKAQLSAKITRYESHDKKYNRAMVVTGNKDFGEISAIQNKFQNPTRQELDEYDQAAAPEKGYATEGVIVMPGEEGAYSKRMATSSTIADPLGMYLNASDEEKAQAAELAVDSSANTWAKAIARGQTGRWDYMHEDDVAAYYYVLNTEGTAAAEKFLDDISTRLAQREASKAAKDLENASTGEIVAATALSILAKPFMSMINAGQMLGAAMKGDHYDPNLAAAPGLDKTRAELGRRADKSSQDAKIFNVSVGDIVHAVTGMEVSELLNTGFSLADSMFTTSGFGSVGTLVLGMDAAKSTAEHVYEIGGTKEQVFASAVMAGTAEAVFEYLSFDRFADNVLDGNYHKASELFKQAAIQGGVEASEEVFTEIANTISNGIIMGRMSDYEIAVEAYKENGMSEGVAEGKAFVDFLSNVWTSAVGGFLSGGVRTAVSGTPQMIRNRYTYNAEMKTNAKGIADQQSRVDDLITLAEGVKEKADKPTFSRIDGLVKKVKADASPKNIEALSRALNDTVQTEELRAARKELSAAEGEQAIEAARDRIAMAKSNPDYAGQAVQTTEILRNNPVKSTFPAGVGTSNKHTGEDIKITGIYRTREKGKPTLVYKLDDGSTIRAQDVSYASDNMAIMAETLAETGIRADYAMALLNTVSEGESGVYVKEGIPEAIRSGMIGENYAMARKNRLAAELSDEQFRLAYEAGQALARDDLNRRKGRASQKTAADVRLGVEDGKLVGTFYDGTQTPVSRVENGASARTLTNTSEDGTVSSDDVKNMARNNKYMEYFPTSHKNGDTHYWCTMWGKSPFVMSGSYALVDYNGKYYEIQKHDDADFGYRIISQLTNAQYKRRKELGQYAYDLSTGNAGGGIVLADYRELDKKRNNLAKRSANDNSPVSNAGENVGVQFVDSRSSQRQRGDSISGVRTDGGGERHLSGQTASGSGKGSGGDKNSYRNAQETVKTTESQKVEGEPSEGLSFVVTDQGVRRETTQAQINVLEAVAKISNTNIEVYASTVVNGERQFVDRRGRIHKGNAAYTRDGNTIMVDIHAGDYLSGLMLNAVSHELVHYIREMNPEGFRALADFVVAKFGEKGESVSDLIRAKQEKYEKAGETLTFDDAYEEVVADSLESMLSQNVEKVMQDIAELRRVDADVAQTLVDKLKEWTGKLLRVFKKNRFDSKPETYEGKCFAKWSEFHEELSHLFAQGVAGAADRSAQAARRTLTKENTPADAEVKSMVRNVQEMGIHWVDNFSDIKDQLKQHIDVVNQMKPVNTVSFSMEDRTRYADKLLDILKTGFGYRVERQDIGTILFDEKAVANMRKYVGTDAEAAAFLSAPYVLKRGKIICGQQNHKNKGYPSVTIAAPVEINGMTGNVAVTVLFAGKRRAHALRILAPNGAVFELGYNKNGSAYNDGNIAQGDAEPSISTTNNSISNPSEKINPSEEKSSLRNVSERQIIVDMLKSLPYEVEHNKYFAEYLTKVKDLDRMQTQLDDLNAEWKSLLFHRGKRSEATKNRLAEIREQVVSLNQKIVRMDRRLLELAEFRPFRNLVQAAAKKQKATDAKRLANYRQEVKTRAEREKVMRIIKDIGSYVLHESKDHHIPAELRKQFAETLSEINLDFSAGHNQQVRDYLNRLGDALDQMKKSDSPLVQTWSDSFIVDMLDAVKEKVGKVSVHDMNQEQLDAVYQLLRVMKKRITSSNRMQAENIKKTASKMAQDATEQIRQWKTKYSHKTTQFSLDNLKPIYFFDRLGSEALQKLYQNILYGQYTYANDLREADEFRKTLEKKYHAENWAMSKAYTFQDRANEEMHLTLADILSLYAHSRREQSRNHLFKHGIVLDEEVVIERNAGGKVKRYKVDDKKNHPLDLDVINRIFAEALTKEMKNYVEDMQDYLSDVMGAKGNEVSLALYDIELFREKHYWPLKTAAWWNAFNPEAVVEPKIKSPSFAKAVNKYATSPIVLQGFSAVWSQHVHDMSMYHGLALPVDDFTRVVNARTIENPVNVGGVRQAMDEVFGVGAGRYVSQLMRDLNGGIRSTDDAWLTKGVSLTKKAATALSLSVAIQQPSSIVRAMAIIEPKYFGKLDKDLRVKGIAAQYDELKKYCPVAYIKEMGNMDTGIGRSAVEYLQRRGFGDAKVIDILKDENYRKQLGSKIDDVIGFLPQFMDQVTWVKIWRAAQNKALDIYGYKSTSDEVKKVAAKIFNDVIERTQVYDSVLSRSGMMRKGGAATKQATAFLSEPTTTINMTYMAIVNAHRNKPGAKAMLWRTLGAVYGATLFNAILKSIITAMRDDDEDETMIEKYVEHLVGNFLSDALVFTNLPYVRDILSLLQGYDVERMDMGLVSDLTRAIDALGRDDVTVEEVLDIVLLVSAMFGIPLNNVKRDIKGMLNLIQTVSDEISGKLKTTRTGILGAMHDGLPFVKERNKSDLLYYAYKSGRSEDIRYYRSRFDDATAADKAIKSELWNRESEVFDATQLRYYGNVARSSALVNRISERTGVPLDLVQSVVMAKTEKFRDEKKPTDEYDGTDEAKSVAPESYTLTDLKLALEQGRETDAVIKGIISDKMANGTTAKQAKNQVRQSVWNTYRASYYEAYKSNDKAEMERIRTLLMSSGLWSSTELNNTIKNYIKNQED